MFRIDNQHINDPRINLALEEYCLRHLDLANAYLLLYINEPSVIIGRHQNVLAEINHRFAMEKGIRVVRRISGGGAVYHDYGNLNYSFIKRHEPDSLANIKKVIGPVAGALNRLGIPALVNDRNDIMANGKKISGTAQFSNTKGIIIHGTLLFDADLETGKKVLAAKHAAIHSNALKSTRSDVVNITSYLKTPMAMDEFIHHLCNCLEESHGVLKAFTLTADDWNRVTALSEAKYNSWDWNFARSPDFSVWKTVPFNGSSVDARIDVAKGRIKAIRFNGGQQVSSEWLLRLKDRRYDEPVITKALQNMAALI